jgi:hypothetical protein
VIVVKIIFFCKFQKYGISFTYFQELSENQKKSGYLELFQKPATRKLSQKPLFASFYLYTATGFGGFELLFKRDSYRFLIGIWEWIFRGFRSGSRKGFSEVFYLDLRIFFRDF